METCILMPRDLSIILLPHPDPAKIFEMGVTLWANRTLRPGHVFRAEEGSIRLDKLEIYDILPQKDIRYKFGCTDTILQVEDREVRHCNWIRFLRAVHNPEEVNVIASRVHGQHIFQIVKTIPPNGELRAYFDLGPRLSDDDEIQPQISLPAHEKENLLISPTRSTGSTGSISVSESPQSDYDDDRSTTLSSDVSPSSTASFKPKETSSDFLCTPSSKGQRSADDFSSTFGSTPDEKRPSPSSSLIGSPPGYTMSPLMTSLPDYAHRDNNPLPLRRKEKTWLPCEVCGKKFDRPSLLKRHMRTHTGEKPHACDVCGKAFSTSSSLNTHRRIHSGEKPHQCQICGKRFTASSNLYYHRMTHKKEKPHKCSMCSKSFPTPGDLKSHMYVHNGSWPFKCDVCNRGFSKQTNLKNHMLLHTGDKPHECRLCGKKFALQCNLKTHLKTHEDEPQDECLRCHRKFLVHKNFVHRGVCHDCSSPISRDNKNSPHINGRHVTSFSIESLASPDSGSGKKARPASQTTPIDMTKAPFYASAMMSAGMMAMHPYVNNGASPFGMGLRWPPPPPISQRFGI